MSNVTPAQFLVAFLLAAAVGTAVFFHAERHSTESGFQIETSICDKLNN